MSLFGIMLFLLIGLTIGIATHLEFRLRHQFKPSVGLFWRLSALSAASLASGAYAYGYLPVPGVIKSILIAFISCLAVVIALEFFEKRKTR